MEKPQKSIIKTQKTKYNNVNIYNLLVRATSLFLLSFYGLHDRIENFLNYSHETVKYSEHIRYLPQHRPRCL